MSHYNEFEETKDILENNPWSSQYVPSYPEDLRGICAPSYYSAATMPFNPFSYKLENRPATLSIKLDITGIPIDMFAFLDVLKAGSKKHDKDGDLNFMKPNGAKNSFKEIHDSMFHHLSMSFANKRTDDETGLDHLLHLATRALIMYTRIKNGIKHDDDI